MTTHTHARRGGAHGARDSAGAKTGAGGAAPARAGIVLATLILVATVANLNLSVANVALPSIAKAFDSTQTRLDLIAVGYSLGLAASVLYLGALGDRYGRKLMLVLGTGLAIPASLLAAFAPSDTVLFAARVFGGLAAGMAYPTTLALITATLEKGPYLLGEKFSAVDILVGTTFAMFLGSPLLPKTDLLDAYVTRVTERPAWVKAQAIGNG